MTSKIWTKNKKMKNRYITKRVDVPRTLYNAFRKNCFPWNDLLLHFFISPLFFSFHAQYNGGALWHPFSFSWDIRYGRKFFLEFIQRFLLRKSGGWKRRTSFRCMAGVSHFAITPAATPNAIIASFPSKTAMKYYMQLNGIGTIAVRKLSGFASSFYAFFFFFLLLRS